MAKWRGSEVAVKQVPQELVPEDRNLVQREISLMRFLLLFKLLNFQ
jgi:hypothetical protein